MNPGQTISKYNVCIIFGDFFTIHIPRNTHLLVQDLIRQLWTCATLMNYYFLLASKRVLKGLICKFMWKSLLFFRVDYSIFNHFYRYLRLLRRAN